jgi:hypothetical protein
VPFDGVTFVLPGISGASSVSVVGVSFLDGATDSESAPWEALIVRRAGRLCVQNERLGASWGEHFELMKCVVHRRREQWENGHAVRERDPGEVIARGSVCEIGHEDRAQRGA